MMPVSAVGGGNCGWFPQVGRRYLIDGSRGSIGLVGTSVCSRTRPIELAADTIDQLKPLLRPWPAAPVAPRAHLPHLSHLSHLSHL